MLNCTLGRVITASIIFVTLDIIWLGFVAKKIYIDSLGSLIRLSDSNLDTNWHAAIVVYIALISGILLFVLPKANYVPLYALAWGAVFGFVTYATYDFTNLAVLTNWSLRISIIDTVWGMVICGFTSLLTAIITR